MFVVFCPLPYAIEAPGPTWNTLGTSTVTDAKGNKKQVPLITVSGGPSYPTTGKLTMLTVSLYGTPTDRPTFFQVVTSWFDPQRAVIPIDVIFPPNVSQKATDAANSAMMVDSQKEAIAAAFTHLGYDVTNLVVDKVLSGSPATGKLAAGDIIESVNGQVVNSISDLRAALAKNGVDKPAAFVYLRKGIRFPVSITPVMGDPDSTGKSVPVIRVLGQATYQFPFKVTIQLNDVGGPSAGLMFSLGVYDKLTPGNLTGGRSVAGTGTIDSSGDVGPIGGIRQKMYGARNSGASYMFVPADNCAEAFGHVPSGLQIFKVSTMTDALNDLKVIAEPSSTPGRTAALNALPTCTTSK